MIRSRWITAAGLTALAIAGAAYAAPGDDRAAPPKTRADVQARIAEHFKKADANGDGFVTRAEADATREAMKAKFMERRAERRSEHFAMLDTDKNGQLSKEEFSAPRQRPDGKDGARAGRGHDGHGKHWGHRGGHGHHGMMAMRGKWFERADVDKDGKVSLAEASSGALARFDRVDTNKDGTISPEERKAARDAIHSKWMERRGEAAKG